MDAVVANNLHVWFHVATLGSFWREVVSELHGEIGGSRLYDHANTLNAVIVGEEQWTKTPLQSSRWKIHQGGELWRYEYPTLQGLWRQAKAEPDAYYLYLHTKGVREENGRQFRALWRRWMSYYLVTRWRESVALLADHDTVGSMSIGPPLPHYSGNFWWARGDWLAQLPEPAPIEFGVNERVWAEMWLMHHEPRPRSYCWGQPNHGFRSVKDGSFRESQITNAVR